MSARSPASCRRFAVAGPPPSRRSAALAPAPARPRRTSPPPRPVPIATPDGLLMSYVLNAVSTRTTARSRSVEPAVERGRRRRSSSRGRRSASWSPTRDGARSAPTSRARRQRARVGRRHPQRGRVRGHARRCRPVGPAPGTGTSQKDARATSAPRRPQPRSADPREDEQWDMQMIKADQAHEITDGSRNVARRRPRQRHRPRPPGPRAEHRRRRVGELHRRRSPGPLRHRLAADHQRPRHARGRHHRRRPQRRRHRRRRAERADGLGQGRQRRRVHLPGVRRLRLRLGRPARHGRDQQQLLRRPVHVLLRGPAGPVRRQGSRAPRRRVVDPTGRRARRRGRQRGDRPVEQHDGHHQPGRRHPDHPHASTAAARTSRPSWTAWSRSRRCSGSRRTAGRAGCRASRTAASARSTSPLPARRILSTRSSSGETATAPRAVRRWLSPQVAGVRALMKSAHPTWTPAQMLEELARPGRRQGVQRRHGRPGVRRARRGQQLLR